jgi:outer membrane lipoprotein SlyB
LLEKEQTTEPKMNFRIPFCALVILALAACTSTGDKYGRRDGYAYDTPCTSCGTVERIDVARSERPRTTGAGVVAGALLGAAAGNQVGDGDGRRAATVAGAIAGGVAGNQLERQSRERQSFAVHVRLDDGRRVVLEQRALDGVREGARVFLRGNRVELM